MTEPLAERVSVVLLTYNCAHRLEAVLRHLCALDVPIVAVDNASTDATAATLGRAPGITMVRLPVNIGAAARNVGVQHVRTPYVAFCDDDGWWFGPSLRDAADLLDAHPRLAVVNARIDVGPQRELDPISAEMRASPLPDRDGIPGQVLLGFMAGAVIVRVTAYRDVGGYQPRYFIGGEEETLALPLLRRGWVMRYRDDILMHHEPSVANAGRLRGYGMRNTLWTCWEHRRTMSALRWTAFTLADSPKNSDWAAGVRMAVRGAPGVLRRRRPVGRQLDRDLTVLDRRRFVHRRPLLNRRDPLREQVDVRAGAAVIDATGNGIPSR